MRSVSATALVCLILAVSVSACSKSNDTAPATDAGPVDDGAVDNPRPPATPVDPLFIGSGGFGFAFGSSTISAAAPNGMAKIGPDTTAPGGAPSFLHYAGYYYGDDTIQGFSHLHLHGTGATDYGVLTVMPLADPVSAATISPAGYGSTFKKSTEKLGYGTYAVTLDRGQIQVEIAATPHGAHHRFRYPAGSSNGHVLFDLQHHLSGGTISDAEMSVDPVANTFEGRLHSVGGMSGGFGGYDVYFAGRAKNALRSASVWRDGTPPGLGFGINGSGAGLALDLVLAADAAVELQLAISFVDAAGAKANLAAELPAWDFDATKAKTAADWKALTDRVQFVGGTKNQQAMMEAARYHAFLMPSRTQDVDGRYRGGDQKIWTAPDFAFFSDLSLWDTYRTLHPFYALVAKDRALDAVRSLVAMAKQRGGSFPKWPIAIGDAGSMIGAPAEIVIADAYARGIRGFDAEEAWGLLRAEALDPTPPPGGRGGRNGAEAYLTLGYVPEKSGTATSKTIELAQADFALAGFAQALGHTTEAAALAARAHGWRKLFDPATKMLWAKDESGAFATSHENPYDWQDEFAEADAAQTVWGAPHDVDGYVALFGSKAAAAAELEGFFEKAKANWAETDWGSIISAGAIRPYYWAANEPDIHAPYLLAQLGRPDLAQKWSRWALENAYGPGADGLPGNDDGGTMSTWLLFTALGIYPVVGTDRFVLGAPLFPQATIALGDGVSGTFTIEAQGVSETAIYVQSVTLDGKALTTPELRVGDLHPGGRLVFVMGAQPSTWGRGP
jgi:predicted alpha-1,2-mannosidase